MSIKIVIPLVLQHFTNRLESVEVKGSSLGECLSSLTKQFPGMEKALFIRNGALHHDVGIYVSGKDAYAEGLAKPVEDGDDIIIVFGGPGAHP